MAKKYASLSTLQTFLDKCKETFASLTHTHSYDDLRNKPFYEGTDYSSIFASTVNFYEWGGGVYGVAVVDAPKVFAQDISHKVIWDGIEYTVTSAYAGDNESGNPIISLGAPYGNYSTYPFGIDSYKTASGTYEYSIHTNSNDATHTIDILELGASYVTLDEKFIPDTIARVDNIVNSDWSLIYDSGEITTSVNSIADINISGYKGIQVVAQNVNDGSNTASAAGAIKFTSRSGNNYLFPAWANFFQSSSGKNTAGMAHFKVLNGWLMMEYSAASAAQANSIFNETEGGSAFKCTVHSGSAFIRCSNELSTMAITSNGQSASNYFGVGSRVMVWGCRV